MPSTPSSPLIVAITMLFVAAPTHGGEAPAGDTPASEADSPGFASKFRDPEDGWLDLSRFLNDPLGFVPLVVPITEPAVGSGLAVVPIFINKPDGGGRPNVAGAGVMRTSNGSEAAFGGYSGYFLDQRLHLVTGAANASINLDFYGIGGNPSQEGKAFQYNLDAQGGMIGGDWKLNDSHWRIGLRYSYFDVNASLVRPSAETLADLQGRGRLHDVTSSLRPSVMYDSRDNIFTPTRGIYSELSLNANLEALGGSSDYQVLRWANLWFHPLVKDRLFFGIKAEIEQRFGDQPFYMRPFVKLRGAPAVRYQGDRVGSFETELRWQVHPRWSLVGFGGAGFTWTDTGPFEGSDSTFTGGAGVRYLIAREHGLHMGLDVAYGEEGTAVYVQFGSAWGRL